MSDYPFDPHNFASETNRKIADALAGYRVDPRDLYPKVLPPNVSAPAPTPQHVHMLPIEASRPTQAAPNPFEALAKGLGEYSRARSQAAMFSGLLKLGSNNNFNPGFMPDM